MANDDWTREEVEAAVADYRRMLVQQLNGQKYNKAEHNRRLREQLNGRSPSSVEFKHQNISAVLEEIGFPHRLHGYPPRGNFQQLLLDVVEAQLLRDQSFEQAASHDADQPAVVPLAIDFEHWIEPPPAPRVGERRADYRTNSRIDYAAREARNSALGLAGEELALEFERARLERNGRESLAGKIEHVARTRGDHEGFDILSFEVDGRERLIEVKTTAYQKSAPFYISAKELDVSEQRPDQYQLYRIFCFRQSPRMFQIQGSMKKQLALDPVSFLATVGQGAAAR